jgi:hypothetical protein
MLTTKEFAKILSDNKTFGGGVHGSPAKPFELSARDFLRFAVEDSKGRSTRQKVNALSNVKRAIDCRIEELLFCYCLHIKSNREYWNIPRKLEILRQIGIVAPKILRKISNLRNRLEHQFRMPDFEEIEDNVDTAMLFLEATERFCLPITHLSKGASLMIMFNRNADEIEFHLEGTKKVLKIGIEDDWLIIAKNLVEKRRYFMT